MSSVLGVFKDIKRELHPTFCELVEAFYSSRMTKVKRHDGRQLAATAVEATKR